MDAVGNPHQCSVIRWHRLGRMMFLTAIAVSRCRNDAPVATQWLHDKEGGVLATPQKRFSPMERGSKVASNPLIPNEQV